MVSLAESIGKRTLQAITSMGRMMIFLYAALATLPFPPYRVRRIVKQVHFIGMKSVFVIDTSPFPSEVAMMADIVLPDNTYLERWQDAPTYPFQGWPLAQIRVPAIKPVHDTKTFADEIGRAHV